MEMNVYLLNPTGNITALVDGDVCVEDQPSVATVIMEKNPSCEQVGFISEGIEGADITLRMAGGEFCGNATMSTAVLFCKMKGMEVGTSREILVKVIGTKGLVPVLVECNRKEFKGTITMPKPRRIFEERLSFEGEYYKFPVVEFNGISHIIIEDELPMYMPERAIKWWADCLKVEGVGLMLLNKDHSAIRPLVYMKYPESLVWESSCASGTTATAAYLSSKTNKPVSYSFNEPGGTLEIEVTSDGTIKLTGKVDFM